MRARYSIVRNLKALAAGLAFLLLLSASVLAQENTTIKEATYLSEIGHHSDAIQILSLAIEKDATAELYSTRGQVYSESGNLYAAIEDISSAIELNPRPDYYYHRAQYYNAVKKPKKAIEDYIYVYELQPEKIELLKEIAILKFNQKEYKQAIDDFQTYLLKIPGDAEAYAYCAKAMFRKSQHSRSIEFFTKAIEADNSKPDYFIGRGTANLELKAWEAADHDFSMALDLNPRDAEVNFFKGFSSLMLNDKETACYYFNRAVKLGYADALEFYTSNCGDQ